MHTDFLEANYYDTLYGAHGFTTTTTISSSTSSTSSSSGGGGGGGVSGMGDCDLELASCSTSHVGGRRLPVFVKLAQGATTAA